MHQRALEAEVFCEGRLENLHMPEAVAAAVPITAQRPSQRHKFLPSDAGGILVNRSPRLSYSLLVCNLKYFSPVGVSTPYEGPVSLVVGAFAACSLGGYMSP